MSPTIPRSTAYFPTIAQLVNVPDPKNPLREEIPSISTFAEMIKQRENRDSALFAYAQAVLFFQFGDEKAEAFQKKALSFPLQEIDRIRFSNCGKNPPLQDTFSFEDYLPLFNPTMNELATCYFHRAVYFYEIGAYKDALDYCLKAKKIERESKELLALVDFFLILSYMRNSYFVEALEVLFALSDIAKSDLYNKIYKALCEKGEPLALIEANKNFLDFPIQAQVCYETLSFSTQESIRLFAINNLFMCILLGKGEIAKNAPPYKINPATINCAEFLFSLNFCFSLPLTKLRPLNDCFEGILKKDPTPQLEYAIAYNAIGCLYYQNRAYGEAEKFFHNGIQVLSKLPKDGKLYHIQKHLLRNLGATHMQLAEEAEFNQKNSALANAYRSSASEIFQKTSEMDASLINTLTIPKPISSPNNGYFILFFLNQFAIRLPFLPKPVFKRTSLMEELDVSLPLNNWNWDSSLLEQWLAELEPKTHVSLEKGLDLEFLGGEIEPMETDQELEDLVAVELLFELKTPKNKDPG